MLNKIQRFRENHWTWNWDVIDSIAITIAVIAAATLVAIPISFLI